MKDVEPPRILIVDDEPFMRATIREMLRLVGRYTTQEAGDGDAALARVDSFRPDIVICDLEMMPTGGIEFVEKLHMHSDAGARATPVIMLTADRSESTVRTAARLGLAGYLVKPVASKQLGTLINAILQRRHAA